MPPTAPRPLHALTSLRFAAAALVVLIHSTMFGLTEAHWRPFHLRQAVSFFFILSGFILTYVHPALPTWGDRGRFLLARFARLWPAHAATFLLRWLLVGPESAPGLSDGLTAGLNLALLHAWVPVWGVFYSWNVVSWSISTEFAFYVAFVFLIPRWRRIWPIALAGSLALTSGLIGCCVWGRLPLVGTPTTLCAAGLLYFSPLARLFEFVLGMTAALLWRRWEPRLKVGRRGGTLLEAAAFALAGAAMYFTGPAAKAVGRLPGLRAYGEIWLLEVGVTCAPFAVLIGVLACERGGLSRLLAWRPFVLLGEISYAVYMLHMVLGAWYERHAAAFSGVPGWRVYLTYWAVVLLGSHLLWAGVERPLRCWIVRLWPAPGAARRPGRARPSLWERLTTPGPVGLAAEAALLATLVVAILGRGALLPR
jgi:peptidoglycan/LPS O-acetylase OafA/YrhL